MSNEARLRPARVVIAGAGLMGRWHAHACDRLGADIVAVVDPRHEAAAALAARHDDAQVFRDLQGALSAVDTDVVHVCTPLESHAAVTETALAAKRHILVEKPLAGSSAETEALLERAREGGLVLNPVHQLPFQQGFRTLLARQGRLGEIVRVAYRTCSAGGEGRSPEERRQLLLEILPHPASLFHRLFDGSFEPSELEIVRLTDDDLDLTGMLGDARLDVSVSLRGRPTRNELEVVGTDATAFADLFHGYALFESGGVSRSAKALRPFRLGGRLLGQAGGNLGRRALRREPAYPGLRELVRRFHASALEGDEPPVTAAEIIVAARLIDRVAAAS